MDSKLSKYSKYIIGFAYEIFVYDINTYIVINKNDKIEFILYKWYDFSSQKTKNRIIKLLKKEGYKELDFYKKQVENRLILKK